ncbi:MAG: 3-keto-5-aminohexanoate cleavage protein, partial [Candidatus Competibacteraceae bacterium]|nr:3-keto-5-aminohexanoate cleavage protein [Candidatus Competibacteraceae bacterium]
LLERGVVPQRQPFVLYVLGRYTVGQFSEPSDLLPMLEAARGCDWHWSVCAFGARENACALTAAALGGHARVGFENNLLLADGTTAPDNAALVAQLVAGARLLGREVADAHQARRLLGMAS